MIFYYSRLSLDSIYICLYIYSHKYTFRSLLISVSLCMLKRLPRWLSGKESACQCRRHRDVRLIPEMGRFPGVGNGNPLQYYCLEIPWREEPGGLQSMGSQRGRSDWSHTHTHTRMLYVENHECTPIHLTPVQPHGFIQIVFLSVSAPPLQQWNTAFHCL